VDAIELRHIEDYKVWLAAQPGQNAKLLAKNTQRHRLRMFRIFLERLIEWDWPDAPGRTSILHSDIPPRSEPIPKFLTDEQAAAFMAAARAHPVARYRLVSRSWPVSRRDGQWVNAARWARCRGNPGTRAEHRRRRHQSPAPLTRSERGASVV
jgi:hypothetical protein